MLHTLNPEKPILDKNVREFFAPDIDLAVKGRNEEEKIESAVSVYATLEKWYAEYLPTDEAKDVLQYFDELFPTYKNISDVKKIDFFLWGKNWKQI